LRKPSSHRATVCLFSFHPLLLSEFERLLTGEDEARVLDRRVEPNQPPDATTTIPRASVYVVEAHSHRAVTEAYVAAILERVPRARLVVIAEKLSEAASFPLLRQGVKGLLRYSEVAAYLPRTLREVASGGFWVPRALLSAFVDSTLETARRPRPAPPGVRMSRREQEVVELLMQNLSNKEIGSKLHMSERTAKFHVSNLLAKYGVQRRADLILLFVQAEKATD
jgi:two-component system response regulator DevR